jgi:hypothetical protein
MGRGGEEGGKSAIAKQRKAKRTIARDTCTMKMLGNEKASILEL